MNKKHVLLVVRWPVGGIRTFIRYVYRNFDPSMWRFTIIAPELKTMQALMEDLHDFEIKWVMVNGIPIDGSSGFWTMSRTVAYQLAREKFDLVHSHGFTSGMCAAVPAFTIRIPHLMTSHDIINVTQFSGFKGEFKKMGMGLLFSMINKIQSVSHDAQENLLSFFPGLAKKNGKYVVIPNGIDTDRFLTAEPRDLRTELGLSDNVFLIGFFGRFMSQKGFRYLVEAIEMLTTKEKDLAKQPVVMTLGEGGFMNREKRLIKKKGAESSFRHLPFAPNIAGIIKGVDVVAMPSLWEACGLLAMEALVCGTPLIASDCIGLREVIRKTPAINIPMRDPQAIAIEIKKLMEESQKEIFKAYVPIAAQRFDVKVQAEKLVDVYNQLLK